MSTRKTIFKGATIGALIGLVLLLLHSAFPLEMAATLGIFGNLLVPGNVIIYFMMMIMQSIPGVASGNQWFLIFLPLQPVLQILIWACIGAGIARLLLREKEDSTQ